MKTAPTLLVAIAMLTGGSICGAATWEATGPNLLANGGFEQGTTYWTVEGQKAAVAVDEEVRHSGKRALRISATGRSGEARLIAGAKVDGAKKYRVSFTAKARRVGRDPKLSSADFVLDMAAAVGLVTYAGNRWLAWCPTQDAVGLRGTSDWKHYSFDVMELPPATTHVQLHLLFHNGAAGTVWFDDVELQELSLRRPSLLLGSAAMDNIFVQSEKAQVEARIANDATPRTVTLRWEVRESHAARMAKGERRVELAAGANRVEAIPLGQEVGHYIVTAELADQGTSRDRDRLEAAVVPDPPREPCPSLGLWPGDCSLARKAGASWTRVVAYWRYIEREPGQWYWNDLDANVKQATAAGLKIVLCFSSMPSWASSAPPASPEFAIYPPKHWDDLAHFVEKVANRLGGDVAAWEIWNEPVIPWGWKGSAADVVTLHRVIHDTIRRVQPHAIILGPCINEGEVPTLKLPAFQAVLPLGILKYCDGLVIHPYRGPRGPEATYFFEELGQLQHLAAEHGLRQGIWITELGWSSMPTRPPQLKTSELDQAAYLVRSLVPAVAQHVRLFNWFELRDFDIPDPSERSFGLVRFRGGGPKPGYVACALCAHYLDQAQFVRRLTGVGRACPPDQLAREPKWNDLRPASIRAVDGYWFQRAGKPLLIAWSISGREETIELPASAEVRVEDALGSVARLSPRAGRIAITLSGLPAYVSGLSP
jgi:hypothetical protein